MKNKNHIKFAEMATKVWKELNRDVQERLKKYFHLRPTSSGVTIVSTLPFAPMRGLRITTEEDLRKYLNVILDGYKKITSDNEKNALGFLTNELKMKTRVKEKEKSEEYFQAIMINNITAPNGGKNLQEILSAHEPVKFVASEFIFEKGKNKIDIVGYDGKDLYFFELKKDRTTKVNQVAQYVNYYKDNKDALCELLRNYPINPVKDYDDIKGVMVMRHAEGSVSDKTWQQLAKKNGIDIIFFKISLSFQKIA